MNLSEIYGLRVLVFFETAPQSNKYNQVLFTDEQYKKMTDTIGKIEKEADENGIEDRVISTSTEEYELPDLQQVYQGE